MSGYVCCVLRLSVQLDCDFLWRVPGQAGEKLLPVAVSYSGGLGVYAVQLDGYPCPHHSGGAARTLLYKLLDCQPGDILEYVPDSSGGTDEAED